MILKEKKKERKLQPIPEFTEARVLLEAIQRQVNSMDASSAKRYHITRSDLFKSRLETQPHTWPCPLESSRPDVRRETLQSTFLAKPGLGSLC